MDYIIIRDHIKKMAETDHKNFVKAVISIEKSIHDELVAFINRKRFSVWIVKPRFRKRIDNRVYKAFICNTCFKMNTVMKIVFSDVA